MQNSVPKAVSVQAGNGHGRLVVISHGDKTKSFALVCVEVADDLDVCNGAERPEHLPQDAFVRVWSQVVDEDAPAGPRVPRDVDASQTGHPVNGHGGEPAEKKTTKKKNPKHGSRQNQNENRTACLNKDQFLIKSDNCLQGSAPSILHPELQAFTIHCNEEKKYIQNLTLP